MVELLEALVTAFVKNDHSADTTAHLIELLDSVKTASVDVIVEDQFDFGDGNEVQS